MVQKANARRSIISGSVMFYDRNIGRQPARHCCLLFNIGGEGSVTWENLVVWTRVANLTLQPIILLLLLPPVNYGAPMSSKEYIMKTFESQFHEC